ncbi:MAG: hydroxyacylglutathione hydrolase [Porticoccaceae bacterium]|nr:MAG: hydroxyacylglutathione hydrolase [Porticoccaceae bacterium]
MTTGSQKGEAMSFFVQPLPAFADNYLWLVAAGQDALVVDPGDAGPVAAALERHGLRLAAILVTHHHLDHTGGVAELAARWHCPVYGPPSPKIPSITDSLREGDRIAIPGGTLQVLEVPGHTLDHIAFWGPDFAGAPRLFCGDTLFAAGCGRLFEGSPQQMWQSLDKLAALPDATLVHCAHEYTLANLRFARAVEPDNGDIAERLAQAEGLRRRGLPTVPSTLELERRTNPFLRWHVPAVQAAAQRFLGRPPRDAVEVFAAIRQWKDQFR